MLVKYKALFVRNFPSTGNTDSRIVSTDSTLFLHHMQNDPAPRWLFCIMSTDVHHHEATLLSIVAGCMSENREGCKIQDSYN